MYVVAGNKRTQIYSVGKDSQCTAGNKLVWRQIKEINLPDLNMLFLPTTYLGITAAALTTWKSAIYPNLVIDAMSVVLNGAAGDKPLALNMNSIE